MTMATALTPVLPDDAENSVANSAKNLREYFTRRGGAPTRMLYDRDEWEECKHNSRYGILLDYYVRAVQLKEERKMPEVGYSFDRRTLSTFASYGGEAQVHSLVCFVCAQIWTDTTGSSSGRGRPFALKKDDIWKGHLYPSSCQ